MRARYITQLVALSTTALGSYYYGSYVEKQKSIQLIHRFQEGKENVCKPDFSIIDTVFAAVPDLPAAKRIPTSPSRVSQIMKYGFPSLDNIHSYTDYVLSYDKRNRVPHWVFEHLTSDSVKKNDAVNRQNCEFRVDDNIHPFFRSENADYRRSGFDRGHMAAAGNHRGDQKHCDDTFYLTNIAPQVGQGFNRDSWNQLESHVRRLTKKYQNVYCCTGPLYLPRKEADGKNYIKYQVIGLNNVAVPTHFFKVIVCETLDGKLEMEAYIMPNQVIADGTPLQVFLVKPETIERAAGMLFFDKINRKHFTTINGNKV